MAPCDFRRMNGGFNNVNPAGGQYIYHDPLQQQTQQQQYGNNDYYGGAAGNAATMLDPLHQFNNVYSVGAPTTVVMPAPAAANTAGVGLSTNCTTGYHAEYDQQQQLHQVHQGYGAGDTTTTMANCNQQTYTSPQQQQPQQQQQQQHYHHQSAVAQHVVAAPPPAPQIPSSSYLATKHTPSGPYDPSSHYLPVTTSSMDPMKPASHQHPPSAPLSAPAPAPAPRNPPAKPKTVMISGLSEGPLTAGEIHNAVASRANEVITRYLPCVDFLVACQQELRQGLAVNRRNYKGRMTPRQYYKSYLEPLPQRFWKKNHGIVPARELSDAMRMIQSLCRDARLAEHLGCEHMKNAFLGGMRDGESWGLRKWLSKHGAALHICNDLELILTGMQKLDASSPFTVDLASKLRNEAGYAHRRLVSDIPKAYQAFSSAHPYLPFFHRLESALKGLAEFDPEDDDVILIDDDEMEALKAKAEKKKAEKRRKEEEGKQRNGLQSKAEPSQQQQRPRKRGREEMNGFAIGATPASVENGGGEASKSSPEEICASWASLSNTTNNSSLGGSGDDSDSDCEVVCVMVKKPAGGDEDSSGGDVGGDAASDPGGGGGGPAPRLETKEALYDQTAFLRKTPSPDFSRMSEAQGVGNGGASHAAADGMNGDRSGRRTMDEPGPPQPEQYRHQRQKLATSAVANQTLPIDGISNDGSAAGAVGNLDDSQFADAEQADFLPSRGDWRCTQCTFLNMDYSSVCLMCESERGAGGAANGNDEGGGNADAAAAVVEEEEKKDFWEGGFGGASFPMPHSAPAPAASPAPTPAVQAEAAPLNQPPHQPQTLEDIAAGMATTVEKIDFSPTNQEQPPDFWDVHWKFVVSVFAAVLRKKEAIWFLEPVEEEELRALGRPEYRSIVRHPLSFRCIIDGLTDTYRCRGQLGSSLDFNVTHGRDLLKAIDLVFLNALAYNGKEKTELRSDALRLRRYFWDRLRKKAAQDPTQLPTKRGETSGFVVVKDAVKNH